MQYILYSKNNTHRTQSKRKLFINQAESSCRVYESQKGTEFIPYFNLFQRKFMGMCAHLLFLLLTYLFILVNSWECVHTPTICVGHEYGYNYDEEQITLLLKRETADSLPAIALEFNDSNTTFH